jgi:molybdopterin-guanine dinucleotide biosynthesis protein A
VGGLRSGVVLVGGRSSRMGVDKGLIPLVGKPLVLHVAERLSTVLDEVIVVCGEAQAETYKALGLRILTDLYRSDTPLVGAYTGLAAAEGEYTFLTAGDQPLIDPRVVELLLREAEGRDAATPSWPNGWIEPLHSVYHTRRAAEAAIQLVEDGEKRLSLLITSLPDIKRVPIEMIRAIDPELRTLMDVDTAEDVDRIRSLAERI